MVEVPIPCVPEPVPEPLPNDRRKGDRRKEAPSVFNKFAYSLGTAVDMWGLWLYPSVAFAVFNMYLGVEPWLVGLALTLIRIWDALIDPIVDGCPITCVPDGPPASFYLDRRYFSRAVPACLVFGVARMADMKFLGLSAVFWYMIVSTMLYYP